MIRDMETGIDICDITGELKTVIDKVYSLEDMQEAHKYVDSGRKRGNVIIKVA